MIPRQPRRHADDDPMGSRVAGILLTGFVVSFCGATGSQGRIWGKVELARGLRHETSLKMEREEKRMERVDGKVAGDYGFIEKAKVVEKTGW